jgi:hypothetical protein
VIYSRAKRLYDALPSHGLMMNAHRSTCALSLLLHLREAFDHKRQVQHSLLLRLEKGGETSKKPKKLNSA